MQFASLSGFKQMGRIRRDNCCGGRPRALNFGAPRGVNHRRRRLLRRVNAAAAELHLEVLPGAVVVYTKIKRGLQSEKTVERLKTLVHGAEIRASLLHRSGPNTPRSAWV